MSDSPSTKKLVIVGGVAGGASAAARARRLSEEAEIVLFERGPEISFANCGLPYHIGEQITDRKKLLVTTPEQLLKRFRIDVRTRTTVEAIDRATKHVTFRNVETGETGREFFDKLILAPGASPFRPPLEGIDLPGVETLRNLQDMDRIKAIVDRGAKSIVLIGAGFIGLELAENLVHRGVEVVLVELQPQLLPQLDPEMTAPLRQELDRRGVRMLFGDSAEAFSQVDNQISIRLKSGEELRSELVILGIGVQPENELAVAAGLETGLRGGIRVNDQLQTSDPDVYAVGDAIETRDFPTGLPAVVPLAGPANRQGRIAADNVFGRASRYRGTQGTGIVGLFGQVAAMTGASEKVLQRRGTPYGAVWIHPAQHASYYPGAQRMTLKLLFEPETGRILGAQGVGGDGVDKRIDVLAVAIQAGMNVFDLEQAELCYAPQFGSAKDPVNMLGFVAGGVVRGDHPQVSVPELREVSKTESLFLIDVRSPDEFAESTSIGSSHIPNAVNIPIDDLRERLEEIPRDKRIVTYCRVGQRGYLATRILLQWGYDVCNLSGGFETWLQFQMAARAG